MASGNKWSPKRGGLSLGVQVKVKVSLWDSKEVISIYAFCSLLGWSLVSGFIFCLIWGFKVIIGFNILPGNIPFHDQ